MAAIPWITLGHFGAGMTDAIMESEMCCAYLQAVALYSLLGTIMDTSASIMSWACGYELAPQFNQPWLSTSLSDFWGRRWNIVASSCLRFLIYEPIIECKPASSPHVPATLTLLSIHQQMLGKVALHLHCAGCCQFVGKVMGPLVAAQTIFDVATQPHMV